jgi:hypothetical protein
MVTPNDVLRFFLELATLAALAYWGFAEYGGVVQWVIGLGAPLLVAVVWGRFMSPKASHPTVDPVRLAIEFAVFGSGVAGVRGDLRGARRTAPGADVRAGSEAWTRGGRGPAELTLGGELVRRLGEELADERSELEEVGAGEEVHGAGAPDSERVGPPGEDARLADPDADRLRIEPGHAALDIGA